MMLHARTRESRRFGSEFLISKFLSHLTGCRTVVVWGDHQSGGRNADVKVQLFSVSTVYSLPKTSDFGAFAAVRMDATVFTWGKASYGGDSDDVQPQLTSVAVIYSTEGAFAALTFNGTIPSPRP